MRLDVFGPDRPYGLGFVAELTCLANTGEVSWVILPRGRPSQTSNDPLHYTMVKVDLGVKTASRLVVSGTRENNGTRFYCQVLISPNLPFCTSREVITLTLFGKLVHVIGIGTWGGGALTLAAALRSNFGGAQV